MTERLQNSAALLVLVRTVNQIGLERSSADIDAALRSYTGPIIFGTGNVDCAHASAAGMGSGVCATTVKVTKVVNGARETLAPIDVSAPSP